MGSTRVLWIDWLKVLAIYLIIAGHLSVPGNRYIYVFSVPAFFILSGLLFKSEPLKLQLSKAFWNLFVPMVLLFFVNFIFIIFLKRKSFDYQQMLLTPVRALFGMQGENYSLYGGLGSLWFVYTLIICRFLMQAIHRLCMSGRVFLLTILSVNLLFMFLCVLLNRRVVCLYNAVVDVLLAFPFFSLGYFLRYWKNRLPGIPHIWLLLSVPVFVCIIWVCGRFDEPVYLYRCSYGHSLFHCLLGGTGGFFLLMALSLLLERITGHREVVEVLGGGTIIILGLHIILVILFTKYLYPHFDLQINGYELYLVAIVFLLCFLPVIQFCKRFLPLVYGKDRAYRGNSLDNRIIIHR